jgi:hypothetical protein
VVQVAASPLDDGRIVERDIRRIEPGYTYQLAHVPAAMGEPHDLAVHSDAPPAGGGGRVHDHGRVFGSHRTRVLRETPERIPIGQIGPDRLDLLLGASLSIGGGRATCPV